MNQQKPSYDNPTGREWQLSELGPVLDALKGMRFGSVEIFIQDSKMVQIERKEKIRDFR